MSDQLSRNATTVIATRRAQRNSRAHRSLHGQRENPSKCRGECRSASFRRRKRTLPLGQNAEWPNELANLRSHAARVECRHHAGRGFRRARGRLLPYFRLQQSGKRGGSRATFEKTAVACAISAHVYGPGTPLREQRTLQPATFRPMNCRQTLVHPKQSRRVHEVFSGIFRRAGSKAKPATAISFLFPDAGRLSQGAGSVSCYAA